MSLYIKNLHKRFGDKILFEDFSYTFPKIGVVAITGSSGSGKTTLFRIIAGLDKLYTGEVQNGGISNTSYAFQEYRLFQNLTALENVTVAIDKVGDKDKENAKQLLSELGFSESDLILTPAQLSGGMKQRVNLARAFMRKRPILILDEPTKELDEMLISALHKIIKHASLDRLVIISSHDSRDIEALADKTIVL